MVESNPIDLMSLYVAYLRALYQIHQNNHWKAKGYGNHLLFQRLYESVQDMADGAAEKAIGVFEDLDVSSKAIAEIVDKFSKEEDPAQSSIKAEMAFQEISRMVYEALDDAKVLSLGLDDMITENAGKSETHIYLLKQI